MTKDLKSGQTCMQYLQVRADMSQKLRVMDTACFKPWRRPSGETMIFHILLKKSYKMLPMNWCERLKSQNRVSTKLKADW